MVVHSIEAKGSRFIAAAGTFEAAGDRKLEIIVTTAGRSKSLGAERD